MFCGYNLGKGDFMLYLIALTLFANYDGPEYRGQLVNYNGQWVLAVPFAGVPMYLKFDKTNYDLSFLAAKTSML